MRSGLHTSRHGHPLDILILTLVLWEWMLAQLEVRTITYKTTDLDGLLMHLTGSDLHFHVEQSAFDCPPMLVPCQLGHNLALLHLRQEVATSMQMSLLHHLTQRGVRVWLHQAVCNSLWRFRCCRWLLMTTISPR